MNIFPKWVLIACAFLATTSFANQADNKTLTLTLMNNSDTALTFTGVKGQNPGNMFVINLATIPPHGEAIITGNITEDNDLAACLHFNDNIGRDNVLFVIDPRNMHSAQPLFNMHNNNLRSEVVSRKTGDTTDAHALYIAASTLRIENVNYK